MPILHWECDRCGLVQSTEPAQSGPKYILTLTEGFSAPPPKVPAPIPAGTRNWWLCAACWDELARTLQRGPEAAAHVGAGDG